MAEQHFGNYRQQGLSLVELMIALLLASFLTMGMVYIFTSNSDTFRLNEASARVQETGRTATQILSRAVRNAGYWGCMDPPEDLTCPDLGGTDQPFACLLNSSVGTDDMFSSLGGDNDVAASNSFNAVEGTDVIRFGGIQSGAALTSDQHTPVNSANMQVPTSQNPQDVVEEGEILVISDCSGGDVFQASKPQKDQIVFNTGNSSGSPGNNSKTQSEYAAGTGIFKPSRNAYYVWENDDGIRSLVFDPMDMVGGSSGSYTGPEELVSHVRDFQVELGRDTTGDQQVDTWSAPGDPAEAQEALAVRFSLLVRSPDDNVVEEPQSYCYPGWLDCANNPGLRTDADDRHLYRVYTSTAAIRNRL